MTKLENLKNKVPKAKNLKNLMENRWQIWKIRRKLMKKQVVKYEIVKNMVAKLKNINNETNIMETWMTK